MVDEINQGMDERNERLVFKRIVECTTGADGPQHKLITPKLLEGLTAMDNPGRHGARRDERALESETPAGLGPGRVRFEENALAAQATA